MNPDEDLTVAAGSRPWAFALALDGEHVWHDGLSSSQRNEGASPTLIAQCTRDAFVTDWYRLSAIRPGQLVEWHRGEAWGVAPYVKVATRPEWADGGHVVSLGEGGTGWWWVERVSPAPAVAYPEQVRLAREALEAIALDVSRDNARGAYAAEALRLMDGGKA